MAPVIAAAVLIDLNERAANMAVTSRCAIRWYVPGVPAKVHRTGARKFAMAGVHSDVGAASSRK
jgi:hypothetical protein